MGALTDYIRNMQNWALEELKPVTESSWFPNNRSDLEERLTYSPEALKLMKWVERIAIDAHGNRSRKLGGSYYLRHEKQIYMKVNELSLNLGFRLPLTNGISILLHDFIEDDSIAAPYIEELKNLNQNDPTNDKAIMEYQMAIDKRRKFMNRSLSEGSWKQIKSFTHHREESLRQWLQDEMLVALKTIDSLSRKSEQTNYHQYADALMRGQDIDHKLNIAIVKIADRDVNDLDVYPSYSHMERFFLKRELERNYDLAQDFGKAPLKVTDRITDFHKMIIFYRTAATMSALSRRLLNEHAYDIMESGNEMRKKKLSLILALRDQLGQNWYQMQDELVNRLEPKVKQYYSDPIRRNVEYHAKIGTFDRLTPGSNQVYWGIMPKSKRVQIIQQSIHRIIKRWAEHDTIEKKDSRFWKWKYLHTHFGKALMYSDALSFRQIAHNFLRTDKRDYVPGSELIGVPYNNVKNHKYFFIKGLTDKFFVTAQNLGVSDAVKIDYIT